MQRTATIFGVLVLLSAGLGSAACDSGSKCNGVPLANGNCPPPPSSNGGTLSTNGTGGTSGFSGGTTTGGSGGTAGSSGTSGAANVGCSGEAYDPSLTSLNNCSGSFTQSASSGDWVLSASALTAAGGAVSFNLELSSAPVSGASYAFNQLGVVNCDAAVETPDGGYYYAEQQAGVGALQTHITTANGPFTSGSQTYYTFSGSVTGTLSDGVVGHPAGALDLSF